MTDFPTTDEATDTPKAANSNGGTGRNMSLRKRSAARLAAVQCVYQLQLNPDLPFYVDKLVSNYRDSWAHGVHLGDKPLGDMEPDYRYLTKLLSGLRDSRELLTPLRERLLSEAWNKDRLPPVMEAIFDAALFELHAGSLGAKLVVDEYVRIAARFFDEKEITFINGVLHGASQQLGRLPAKVTDTAHVTEAEDARDDLDDSDA